MVTNTIGKNISEQRHLLKMTQEQLAEQSGLTSHYLSKVERGVMSNISAQTLYRISQALNISMEELMIGKTNEQRITNAEQRQLDKELSKAISKASELKASLDSAMTPSGTLDLNKFN